MSCDNKLEKFVITKGFDNTFEFVIKADGTTLPMEIQSSDTFTAHVRKLDTGDSVLTKTLSVVDAPAGKVKLEILAADTVDLVPVRGAYEDRFYLRPAYSLVLECSTAANGDFLAKVPYVYVD